jgi:hypothetical protein
MYALLILLSITRAFAFSSAQGGNYHYDYCTCHFGYGNTCAVVESCGAMGGRCSGTCAPSKEDLQVRAPGLAVTPRNDAEVTNSDRAR